MAVTCSSQPRRAHACVCVRPCVAFLSILYAGKGTRLAEVSIDVDGKYCVLTDCTVRVCSREGEWIRQLVASGWKAVWTVLPVDVAVDVAMPLGHVTGL